MTIGARVPILSVIVPVYNGAERLERCLEMLAASEYRDFEVVVADDGSTEEVEPLVARRGFRYLRVSERGRPGGPARARNRGVAASRGPLLVFIDGDVCAHPDALGRFAAAFASDPGLAAVFGSYDDDPPDRGLVSRYKNLAHRYYHQASQGDVRTFWTGCGAMRREVFLSCGGFDEVRYRRPAIEDIELGLRASRAGHRIRLDGRIQARHLKRWTWWGLLKTDIRDRGIPWTRLMWEDGRVDSTLNVEPGQRASVALVYLTLLLPAAGFWWAAALPALAVTLVNREFYQFMARRAGWWFAVRVVPLHWLYFLYCGACAVVGTALHFLRGGPRVARMRRISE